MSISREEELKSYFNEELIEDFKREVNDKAEEIDENSEYDWFVLTYGWALGKGLKPENAHSFSIYIRYYTDLG